MSDREEGFERIPESTRNLIELWCSLRDCELDPDLKGLFALAFADGRLDGISDAAVSFDRAQREAQ